MTVKNSLAPFVMLLLTATLFGQDPKSTFDFGVAPYLSVPVRQASGYLQTGGGSDLTFSYRFGELFQLGAVVDAAWVPLGDLSTSLSIFGAGARTQLSFGMGPTLALTGQAAGGYYYARLNDDSGIAGGNPWILAGLGLDWAFAKSWVLAGDADWRSRFGLVDDLRFTLALRFQPEATAATATPAPTATPTPAAAPLTLPQGFIRVPNDGRGLKLVAYRLEPVFPVLRKTLETAPSGQVVIHNFNTLAANHLDLAVELKGVFDKPRKVTLPASIPGKGEVTVDLPALFTDKLIAKAEGGLFTLGLNLTATQGGRVTTKTVKADLVVAPWKALVWDSPARAASFITPKSPGVKSLGTTVQTSLKTVQAKGLNSEFQAALATHTALRQLGVAFLKNPSSAFNTQKAQDMDTLQFPDETLAGLTGDRDDLAVLWCSILESMGIDTATLTFPGHILPAFALVGPPQDILALLGTDQDYVVRNGKYWVPLETSVVKEGFLAAWKEGARLVRERKDVQFTSLKEAWSLYPSSASLGPGPTLPDLSDAKKLEAEVVAILTETTRQELKLRINRTLADLKTAPPEQVSKLENKLGILYARDQQFQRATEVFKGLAAKNYVPGMTNLATVYLLSRQTAKAAAAYEDALKFQKTNKPALTGAFLSYRILAADKTLTKAKVKDIQDNLDRTMTRIKAADRDDPNDHSLQSRMGALTSNTLEKLQGFLVWCE